MSSLLSAASSCSRQISTGCQLLDSYAVVGPSRMSACATLTPLLTSAVGDQHLPRHFHPFGCCTTSRPVASALPALPSALRSLALATPIRVTPGSPGPCTAALSVLSCLVFRPGRRVPSVYNSSWIANMFKHDSDASQLVEHPCTISKSSTGNHRTKIKLVGYTTRR